MSKKHIFSIGDVVRAYGESIEGTIVYVGVNQESNTEYIVNFINDVCARFLAKDLTLIEEDEK